MNQTEIALLEAEDTPLATPPTHYDYTTVVNNNGQYYLCHTKCPSQKCERKQILHVEVKHCLITRVLGEWWVKNPTGPEGNMTNVPCPDCRPTDEDRQKKLNDQKTKPIHLPGVAAAAKYTRISFEYRARRDIAQYIVTLLNNSNKFRRAPRK